MSEYTGQCVGGPDDGNLVTATVTRWWHEAESRSYLDGPEKPYAVTRVLGWYNWDPARGAFAWELLKMPHLNWPDADEIEVGE